LRQGSVSTSISTNISDDGPRKYRGSIAREANNQLKPSDHPLLGLVSLARLKLPELINPASTIELKNRLEGASNHLTRQVLKYWSQNSICG
jgi:hypothetical protein